MQFYCPPPTDKYFSFCLYCPIPPAKYLYFSVSLYNSTAPSFLLKGTSPFACVFKPWAWLIHLRVLIQLQNGFRVVTRTRPSSLSTPHLVIRRRSPRDPRITGPAGWVKWRPTWGTRYDCPPDNGLRIKEVPRRQKQWDSPPTLHSSVEYGRREVSLGIQLLSH